MVRRIQPLFLLLALGLRTASAQDPSSDLQQPAPPAQQATDGPSLPAKVDVESVVRDSEIENRLVKILRATQWFIEPQVTVNEGVAFLAGKTDHEKYKEWAANLARNTEGVVAVANRIEVTTPSAWDFSPAREEFKTFARTSVRALPLLAIALVILALAWAVARMTRYVLRRALRRKVSSRLLREVAARGCGILVFLFGLYLVLRISGLTRLAVTVVGGTGLIGLILGIAFRDITENFLASLFLSLQQPFRAGDLIEIEGITGYVQRLTSRTTVLMTLDGNQVQVPNSTVFKSTIRNFTSNPNRRESFVVGIGYDDPIPFAQEVALKVLAGHPAVLRDPEPWVLVDHLGKATVNLQVYFWLDGSKHSWLKVRSSVIRLVKRAFQDASISLPDEAREVVFPDGVPVRMVDAEVPSDRRPAGSSEAGPQVEAVSTQAETGLRSEAHEIKQQAQQAWSPEQGENLLENGAADSSPSKDD